MTVDNLSNKIGFLKGRVELVSIRSNTSFRTEPALGTISGKISEGRIDIKSKTLGVKRTTSTINNYKATWSTFRKWMLRTDPDLQDAGQATQVDHHKWTREAVFSDEIVNILSQANIDAVEVMDYIDGSRRSILRNKEGTVHADHLDSWVRSAYIGGYLPISTGELLNDMNYRNGSLQFTPEGGKLVTELIWEEARMQVSTANIGINAMMRKLVRCLIINGDLHVTNLPNMTDMHIEQLLCNDGRSIREEYERLLMESWRIRLTREKPNVTAEKTILSKLYLAMPLIGRRFDCRNFARHPGDDQ